MIFFVSLQKEINNLSLIYLTFVGGIGKPLLKFMFNNFDNIKINALCVIEFFVLANKEENEEMANVLRLTTESFKTLQEKTKELTVETLNDVKKLEDFRVLIKSAKSAVETFIVQLAKLASIIDDIEIENKARTLMFSTLKVLMDIHTKIENL